MNLWEFRQAIESAIPAWIIIPILAFGLAVVVYGIATRGIRK